MKDTNLTKYELRAFSYREGFWNDTSERRILQTKLFALMT